MAELAAPVVSAPELAARVEEIGAQIAADYAGRDPVLVGVLIGAIPFLADLVRAIDLPLEVDFLALTSFGDGSRVRLASDSAVPLTGRNVVVVATMVDTGLTMASILRLLEPRSCASVATVTLFDKSPRRIADIPLTYRGFEVGDEFLIGYGLDYQGWFRNLGSVWAVMDLPAMTADPGVFAASLFGWLGDRLDP
ncbi:MAG: phosphoribosyltransferase family protein [Acidimicrobiia bacterium]|nr:phosphoribosyltransferase family protein [Acidimicrobiia bacterium]